MKKAGFTRDNPFFVPGIKPQEDRTMTDKKLNELNDNQLNDIAGGADSKTRLSTLEMIEASSIFEPLKAELSKLKASGYDPNYERDKLNIISELHHFTFRSSYTVSTRLLNMFLEKYWSLV
jgi:hypothetical protein